MIVVSPFPVWAEFSTTFPPVFSGSLPKTGAVGKLRTLPTGFSMGIRSAALPPGVLGRAFRCFYDFSNGMLSHCIISFLWLGDRELPSSLRGGPVCSDSK